MLLTRVFLLLTVAHASGNKSSDGQVPGEWFKKQFEEATQRGKKLFFDPALHDVTKMILAARQLRPRSASLAEDLDTPALLRQLPNELVALIASYTASKHDTKGLNRLRLSKTLSKAIDEYKNGRSNMFADAVRWDRFDDTHKGRHTTLSNDNVTLSNDNMEFGTVRAGPWVPRDGCATATVRVDREDGFVDGVQIGVVAEGYTLWDDGMVQGDHAWYHYKEGTGLTVGSEVTVTLTGGTVIFAHNGTEVSTVKLPENCGRISLAVSIFGDSQVTLL